MGCNLRGLTVAAIVMAAAVPAMAQGKASNAPKVAPQAGDTSWNLVLTIRPDQARKAANDLVQMVKNPSAKSTPILSDLLGILSARIAVEDSSAQAAKKTQAESLAQRMATSTCAAALNTIGQHATVVRDGYGALAAGLPDDKVAQLRQQVTSLTTQLVGATRAAIEQVRK